MKSIKYIMGIFGILVVLYLFMTAIRQGLLARNASITPVGWRKNFIGIFNTSITVFFEAKNTTDLDLTLKNIKIDVLIDDKKVTEIHKKNVHVPASDKVITEAVVRFNPSEALYDATEAVLRIGDIPIRFRGHLDLVTSYFFWNRIKIDKTTTLSQLSA